MKKVGLVALLLVALLVGIAVVSPERFVPLVNPQSSGEAAPQVLSAAKPAVDASQTISIADAPLSAQVFLALIVGLFVLLSVFPLFMDGQATGMMDDAPADAYR